MAWLANWKERALFLTTWLRNPAQVGSLTPSAPALADAMVAQVPWHRVRTVVELGAGTGAITERILRCLPGHVRFLAFEKDPTFLARLQMRFPGIELHAEAAHLAKVLLTPGEPGADVILSGLPFAAMPRDRQEQLLDEIQSALAPGGLFIAFQYSPHLYRRLRARFSKVEITFAFLNLPPAIIYRCTAYDD